MLIAIIVVFIHDPLFNWCSNDTTTESKQQKDDSSPASDEEGSTNSYNQAQKVLGSLKRKLDGIEEGVVLGVETRGANQPPHQESSGSRQPLSNICRLASLDMRTS